MRRHTMPDDFVFSKKSREKVKSEFNIDDEEVDRILKIIYEWEFTAPRSDWNRVCLRWFRTANERGELKRPRTYTNTIAVLTEEEKAADQKKWEEDMKRLRVVK